MNDMLERLRSHHNKSEYERGHRDAYEQGLFQILARLDRLENVMILEITALLKLIKTENEMKQSTQDLIDAFGQLSTKIGELEALVDQAVDTSDEEAKAALLAQIKDKTSEISGHLPTVASTATTVAQSDADTGATVAAS